MTDISSLGQTLAQAATEQAPQKTAEPSASDESAFKQAMGKGEQPQAANPEAETQNVPSVKATETAEITPGNRILEALGHYQKQGQAMGDSLANVGNSPADMLKFQMQVMQHSATTELMSKAVGKATQTVETLLKSG